MDIIIWVLGGIGIGIPAGISPYIPLLVISVAALGKRTSINPDLGFLNSWAALVILAVLVGIDVFADKLPRIENLYRGINLIACPIAGGLAAAAIIPNSTIPSAVSFLIGLCAAEAMYLVKSSLKKIIIADSKSNLKLFLPMISMGEDLLAAVLAIFALAWAGVSGIISLVVFALYGWWFYRTKRQNIPAKVEA